jgi:FkbM family methyltransferase
MKGERYPDASVPLADLVYDVGMHDGADSAYYLQQGFRVVAVEANPVFAERAHEQFAREIQAGRLTILNVGIAPGQGEASFWVCEDHTDWSSFDRENASRKGARHHPIMVRLRPFDDILRDHGVPHYCKIDIEGNDHLCLKAMTAERRPSFVSVEVTPRPLLARLCELGYTRFKVLHQLSYTTPNELLYAVKGRVPIPRLREAIEWGNRLARRQSDGGWRFPVGSSGPLPHRTRGRWLTAQEVDRVLANLERAGRCGRAAPNDWFDLHATTAEALTGIPA